MNQDMMAQMWTNFFGEDAAQNPFTGHNKNRNAHVAPVNYQGLKQYSHNEKNFGMDAFTKAQEGGHTKRQIRSMLAGSGLKIGDQLAAHLNVNPIQTVDWATDSTGENQRPILAAAGAEGPGWGSTSGLVTDSQYAKGMGGNIEGIQHGAWGQYFDPSWDRDFAYDEVGGYNRPPSQEDMWGQMMQQMMSKMFSEDENKPVMGGKDGAPGPSFSRSTSSKPSYGVAGSSGMTTTQSAQARARSAPTLQTLNI